MTTPEPNPNPLDLLERALPYIKADSSYSGYGFMRPDNPHDFSPDPESCSAEEIANHKAACEAYDRGEYKRDPSQDSGWVGNCHILKAPWGIGCYTVENKEVCDLIVQIEELLAARQKGAAK